MSLVDLYLHLSALFGLFNVYPQMLLNLHWLLRQLYPLLSIILPVENALYLSNCPIVQFEPVGGSIFGILDIDYFPGLIIQQNGLKRAIDDRLVGARYLLEANFIEAYQIYVSP